MRYRIERVRRPIPLATQELILALDRKCFPADEPVFIAGHEWWLVRDESRAVVGFAGLLPNFTAATAYMSRVGVLPEARGQGLHPRLLAVRERYARSIGATLVVTYTVSDNHRSSNNLIKRGYKLYTPSRPWSGLSERKDILYWKKEVA